MTPNEVESLFLRLMEKAVINLQRLEDGIDNIIRTQEILLRDFRDLRNNFEELSSKTKNFQNEIRSELKDLKQEVNLFTRRVDVINREILAVKSIQDELLNK